MTKVEATLITFGLLSIPILVEWVMDYRRIVLKKKEDDHDVDTMYRGILIVIISIINSVIVNVSVWQSALLGIAYFWLVFDYGTNLLTKRKFFYLGKSSWLDRKLREINPLVILFTKIWLFGLGIGVYYYWDRVINNWQPYFK